VSEGEQDEDEEGDEEDSDDSEDDHEGVIRALSDSNSISELLQSAHDDIGPAIRRAAAAPPTRSKRTGKYRTRNIISKYADQNEIIRKVEH
jgi:hypothetical protein